MYEAPVTQSQKCPWQYSRLGVHTLHPIFPKLKSGPLGVTCLHEWGKWFGAQTGGNACWLYSDSPGGWAHYSPHWVDSLDKVGPVFELADEVFISACRVALVIELGCEGIWWAATMVVLKMDVGRALVKLQILCDVFQWASLYKVCIFDPPHPILIPQGLYWSPASYRIHLVDWIFCFPMIYKLTWLHKNCRL